MRIVGALLSTIYEAKWEEKASIWVTNVEDLALVWSADWC